MGITNVISSAIRQGFERERALVGNTGDIARKGALAGLVAANIGAQAAQAANLPTADVYSAGDIAQSALSTRLARYQARENGTVGRAFSQLKPSEVKAPPATDGLKPLTRIENTGNRYDDTADGVEVTGRGAGRIIGGGRVLAAPAIPSSMRNFEPVR